MVEELLMMLKTSTKLQVPVKYTSLLFKPKHKPSKLLKLAANAQKLKAGKTVHAHLITTNQATQLHSIEANSLINFYAKCGQFSIARKLFDEMLLRNVVSWSSLMAAYFHHGYSLEVIGLLEDMIFDGNVRPNEYIFSIVVSCCGEIGRVVEGKVFHGYVLKCGLVFFGYVRNALVGMYLKLDSVEEAMWVWNSVNGKSVFDYNLVLNGLVERGCVREGLEVLRRMVSENVKWDNASYVNVFGLCACCKDLRLGIQVHGRMLMSDVECDAYVNSAIINMYGKCGDVLSARRVFDGLSGRNVVLWTAIMTAYFQNGCCEEALRLVSEMELEDVRLNDFTLAVLLNASADLSSLRTGCMLHARAEKLGFEDHIVVGNALINMYAKCGDVEAANLVFSGMRYRDTITWNAMICGYSHHGLGKETLLVFQDMLGAYKQPNYVTFVGVLSACDHLGLVQEGFSYLYQMKQIGIEPGLEHYTCLVGLLSKAGRLDEARNFMRSTPVKWDVVAWRTLLNACNVHQNYGLGRKVAEVVLEMDPHEVGTYTLLSNMYAKEKRWDGVVKIRKLMRDKNIKKEPGVSWIEIRNVTHVFVSDDNKHPEFKQIHEKVKELLAMIKPLGYVPDVSGVVHDVEDEQKEDYLRYHSEKLAVAYGLIKTPSNASIVVIKNLRMCDDCHLAIKLISKVTSRQIIVRDTNRFHHFRDGCCSCSDYW